MLIFLKTNTDILFYIILLAATGNINKSCHYLQSVNLVYCTLSPGVPMLLWIPESAWHRAAPLHQKHLILIVDSYATRMGIEHMHAEHNELAVFRFSHTTHRLWIPFPTHICCCPLCSSLQAPEGVRGPPLKIIDLVHTDLFICNFVITNIRSTAIQTRKLRQYSMWNSHTTEGAKLKNAAHL